MKRTIYVFGTLLMALMLCSCATTLSLADLRPEGALANPLPTLAPEIDTYSLESVYSSWPQRYSRGTGVGVSLSSTDDERMSDSYIYIDTPSSRRHFRDQRVQDAVTIFTREVTENISRPTGPTRGTVNCRIASGSAEMRGQGLLLLSGCFFLVPSLLGLPYGFSVTELDVNCDIYDSRGDCIGRYNAIGKCRIPLTFYTSYSSTDRKTAVEALKKAMKEIKLQIERDSARLTSALQQ